MSGGALPTGVVLLDTRPPLFVRLLALTAGLIVTELIVSLVAGLFAVKVLSAGAPKIHPFAALVVLVALDGLLLVTGFARLKVAYDASTETLIIGNRILFMWTRVELPVHAVVGVRTHRHGTVTGVFWTVELEKRDGSATQVTREPSEAKALALAQSISAVIGKPVMDSTPTP